MWSASPIKPCQARWRSSRAVSSPWISPAFSSSFLRAASSSPVPTEANLRMWLWVEGSQVQKQQNLQDENICSHCLWDLDVEPHQWPPIIRDGIDTIPFTHAFIYWKMFYHWIHLWKKNLFKSSHLAILWLTYTALLVWLALQQGFPVPPQVTRDLAATVPAPRNCWHQPVNTKWCQSDEINFNM